MYDPAAQAHPRSQDALVPRCHLSVQPQLEGLFFFLTVSAPTFSLHTQFLGTAPMPMASWTWRRRPPTFPLNAGPTAPGPRPPAPGPRTAELCACCCRRCSSSSFLTHHSPFILSSLQLPMHCRASSPPRPCVALPQARPRGWTTPVNPLLILLLQCSFSLGWNISYIQEKI